MSRRSLGLLVGAATALFLVHALLALQLYTDNHDAIYNDTWIEAVIYIAAGILVWRAKSVDPRNDKRALVFILVFAGILRGMLLFADPVSSDINRYIWDGRVQGAGINPYLYVPADPKLAFLRDDDIYPEINRKEYAPTIYPPMAQIVFFLVTRVSEQVTAMKAAMVAFEAAGIWAMLRLLKARSMPLTRIIFYAWHPLPIWEFAGSGHVDAIVIATVLLGLAAAQARKPILVGLALAGATLTKFFPAVIGPAYYRRWDWKLPLTFVIATAVLYLPYISAGRKVFGFLGGYTEEEGLENGSGLYPYVLIRYLIPGLPDATYRIYLVVVALMTLAIGVFIVFRRRRAPGADIAGAFALATVVTFVTSPHFAWYFAWLVPFLCFFPSAAVLWLTCSAAFMNPIGWPPALSGGSIIYLTFIFILIIEITLNRRKAKNFLPPSGVEEHDGSADCHDNP